MTTGHQKPNSSVVPQVCLSFGEFHRFDHGVVDTIKSGNVPPQNGNRDELSNLQVMSQLCPPPSQPSV